MDSSTTVVVQDLSEQFRLVRDRARTLKEVISRLRFSRGTRRLWALTDVSLEFSRGEVAGLIGENGSGKTTLLRCIAGILPPTRGRVLISGTVASLIELGAGFHPELTGRENLLTLGPILGMPRRDVLRKFDSIVSFAELEKFINQPVRSYSSGMYVRLAFSLAVHLDPDVLLIDEVLAVGDESFQRKCVERVAELGAAGVTVIFVSHDLPLVQEVCNRCIWLKGGRVFRDGDAPAVVSEYHELQPSGGLRES